MRLLSRKIIRIRAAGIVIKDEKILLVSHKKNGHEYWLLPGGGVEYGESVKDALVREMLEELSVNVDVGDLIFSCDSIDPSGSRHVLNLCLACEHKIGEFILGSDRRLSGFAFFGAEEIEKMKLFPPCSKYLAALLRGEKQSIYQGPLWEEL